MLRKIKIGWVVVLVALTSLACQAVTLTQKPEKETPRSEVLFQDDFSNQNSGWTTWNQEVSQVSYQSGGLHIRVNEPSYDYWARPGKRFEDAQIEVDATKVSGPDNNDFGLICRYRNGDNFYEFVASSDGYFGIVRVKDGKYEVIGGGQLQYSEAIQRGSAANHLRGDCIGNTLSFYINGKRVGQAQDSAFPSGEVGVLAGTYDAPGVEIQFDNFIVLKP